MDNERCSLPGDPSDGSSSCESLQNYEDRNELSESCEDECEKTARKAELVLDLRNIPTISNVNSEDEDVSEKLSAVIEQPEDPVTVNTSSQITEENEEHHFRRLLMQRVQSLNEVMGMLRDNLKKEVSLWRKEKEEFQLLKERNDAIAIEEATAAAMAAAAAYAAESPLSTDLRDTYDLTSDDTLSELTILEYERKLAKYQDAIALAQAEKRYNARRHLLANAYKQKLLEVERLCNEELEKIRQNACVLQPLKEMASQWDRDEGSQGDSMLEYRLDLGTHKLKSIGTDYAENLTYRKIDAEVNMVPEILVSKYKNDDSLKRDKH